MHMDITKMLRGTHVLPHRWGGGGVAERGLQRTPSKERFEALNLTFSACVYGLIIIISLTTCSKGLLPPFWLSTDHRGLCDLMYVGESEFEVYVWCVGW